MTLRLAIVADDLTGALDTATPFVLAGLQVAVAVTRDDIAEALATGADVVAVNTASRALGPAVAAERVARATSAIMRARPQILFKKVDSRLKGNPGAEAHAMADAADRHRLVVAPAVPDQGRRTEAGHVVGRGVEAPIAITPAFGHGRRPTEVVDARVDSDLDTLVARTDWTGVVAVGARGLGLALARSMGQLAHGAPLRPTRSILFALGSRDPITVAQMDALAAEGRLGAVLDSPGGTVPASDWPTLPALVRMTGALDADAASAARGFAEGIVPLVRKLAPEVLLVGGGDTALAVLDALGVHLVEPRGEVAAGVPWFDMFTSDGQRIACSVKSGGFGDTTTLLRMLDRDGAPTGEPGASGVR